MTNSILPIPRTVFYDANGNPLSGGKVYQYIPSTTTPKTTWQDSTTGTPNAQPITLDSSGSCLLYGNGSYQLTVQDALGNAIAGYSGLSTDPLSPLTAFEADLASTTDATKGTALVGYKATYTGAVGRTLEAKLGDLVSAKDFGATGDGVTDDTAALQAWLTYLGATAGAGYLPIGVYIVSSGLTVSAAVNIRGAGTGVGPGLANGPGSIIMCKAGFTTGDVLTVTTIYSCCFRDFQIAGPSGGSLSNTSAVPRTTGAGLHLKGTNPGTNECSRIENVAFNGLYIGLQCTLCVDHTVRACYFQCYKQAAYYVDGAGSGVECSAGHVSANKFFGDPTAGTTQVAAIISTGGYTNIFDNVILGSQYGIQIQVSEHALGHIGIKDNNIEEQTVDSVLVNQVDPYTVSSLQITGNEFSNITNTQISNHIHITGATAASIFDMNVSDNDFSSTMLGGTTAAINIQYGTNMTVVDNHFNLNSCYAILMGSNVVKCSVLDNRIQGSSLTGTTGYAVNTNVVIRDLTSRTFTVALLPTPDVGSQLWVTNGHATNLASFALNFTVTAGGSGCVAHYAGAWRTFDA